MTPVTCMAGRRLALFGLGGSGVATASALLAGGADVVAWDDDADRVARAHAAGIPTADLRTLAWERVAGLVLSPGVPLTHPVPHWTVPLARAAGTEIVGDIELFCRERRAVAPDAVFVAITGTNGKSTTTALVSHILAQAGRDVQTGGNIGTAILSLDPPAPGRVHVVEMSSFQIDLSPTLDPSVGVLLNVTPDHLDRHGTMEDYAAIKARLASGARVALVGVDDAPSEAVALRLSAGGAGRLRALSAARALDDGVFADGVFADGTAIVSVASGGRATVADIAAIRSLRGRHNAQNAAAAVAVCLALDVHADAIAAGLASFPGLPHRMEEVGRVGPVLFVNDSKATNADSTEKALLAFDDVHWIAGGVPKAGGIEPLRSLFTRIRKAYLIGEASEAFAASLGEDVPHMMCGTLENAVAAAAAEAGRSGAAEPVVLLSPACASYDQFPNFEKRGDRFRDLVRVLPGLGG